ncbi:hypothetical protein ACWPKO_32770 (plasmid) [Coraliomargarita sp. W4R53]
MDSPEVVEYFERVETQPDRRKVARLLLWAQAIVLIVVGTIMTSVRTFTQWEEYPDEGGGMTAYSGDTIEIWPIGLALLCVGLVVLAAALVVEASRVDAAAVVRDPSVAASAQSSTDDYRP